MENFARILFKGWFKEKCISVSNREKRNNRIEEKIKSLYKQERERELEGESGAEEKEKGYMCARDRKRKGVQEQGCKTGKRG
jgi:hypothetical protein